MRASLSILALVGAVGAVDPTEGFNVFTSPGSGSVLTVGQKFTITWQSNAAFPGNSGLFLLGGGSPATLQVVETLTQSIDNTAGSFEWTVDGDPTLSTFGLEFIAVDSPGLIQFSFPFKIMPADGGSTSTTPTVTSTTTTAPTGTTTGKPTGTGTWKTTTTKPTTTGPPANTLVYPPQNGSPTSTADDYKTTGTGSSGHGSWGNGTNGAWPNDSDCSCDGEDCNGNGGSGSGSNYSGTLGNGTTPAVTETRGGTTSPTGSGVDGIFTGAASKAVAGGFAMFGGAAIALLAL